MFSLFLNITWLSEELFPPRNSNFLDLVQLIAKLDPVMQEHLQRIKDEEIRDHYLDMRIHNELIQLIGNKVQKIIVDRIKSVIHIWYSTVLQILVISHEHGRR